MRERIAASWKDLEKKYDAKKETQVKKQGFLFCVNNYINIFLNSTSSQTRTTHDRIMECHESEKSDI